MPRKDESQPTLTPAEDAAAPETPPPAICAQGECEPDDEGFCRQCRRYVPIFEALDLPCPQTGTHPGVPDEEYFRWDAASKSQLSCLKDKGAGRFCWEMANCVYGEESASKRLGTLAHLAMLQPDQFEARVMLLPTFTAPSGATGRQSKYVREAEDQWRAELPKDAIVASSQAEVDAALAMRDACYANTVARTLIERAQVTELAACARDPVTGLAVKVKVDVACDLGAGGVCLADVKTARDERPEQFEKDSDRFFYHGQARFYEWVWKLIHQKRPAHFAAIVLRNEEPYTCVVYQWDAMSKDVADAELRRLLDEYSSLYRAGGVAPRIGRDQHGDHVLTLALPDWQIRRYENSPEVRRGLEVVEDVGQLAGA